MLKDSVVVHFEVLAKYLFEATEGDKENCNHFSCYLTRSPHTNP
jgi:hypothetical protein